MDDYPLDLATVDRIITAAGGSASNIHREALLEDLKHIWGMYESSKLLRQAPAEVKRKKAAIVRTAKQLRSYLADSSYAAALRRFNFRYTDKQERLKPDDLKELLDRLIGRVTFHDILGIEDEPSPIFAVNRTSLLEWLVGFLLRQAFEQHFKMRASITQVPGENIYKGEYLEFAQTVINEFGMTKNGAPYSRATIAAALWQGSKKGPRFKMVFGRGGYWEPPARKGTVSQRSQISRKDRVG